MVKYGSPTRLRDHHVKRMIVEDVEQPHDRATFPGRPRVVDFTAFSAHNPFELGVSSEQIAAGFYTRLGSLQGRNRTFYNGAAFHTHDSGLLWQFSDDQAVRSILSTAFRTGPCRAAVSHGVFSEGSMERPGGSPIERLLVTDSIETQPVTLSPKVEVGSVAPLFGEAIRRIHNRESISGLFPP